jgi:hypothetical protein
MVLAVLLRTAELRSGEGDSAALQRWKSEHSKSPDVQTIERNLSRTDQRPVTPSSCSRRMSAWPRGDPGPRPGYVSRDLGTYLAERGVRLLRPSYRNRAPHPARHLLKPVRQLIEWVNDTLNGQLDLELHGGRTIDGVTARIAQRILVMTAAIWHDRATGQPITRSLIAYYH